MQNQTLPYVIFFLFFFSNISLAQFYYSPDAGNVNMLKEKNDFHCSASFQSSIFSKAPENLQIELGFSPRQFVSIQSNFFLQNYKSKVTGFNAFYGKYYSWNTAVGVYYFFPQTHIFDYKKKRLHQRKPLFKKKSKWIEKEGLMIDYHLGYGEGRSSVFFRAPVFHQLSFQKYYSQFGIHWFGKIIGLSYTHRMGFIHYYKLQGHFLGLIGRTDLAFFDGLTNSIYSFHESTIRILAGVKQAKYFINLSRMNNAIDFRLGNYNNYNFNMGFILSINDFFERKNSKKKKRKKKKKKKKKRKRKK